jgi:hypothetical protein
MEISVKKGNIVKTLDNERLVADYVTAGWEVVKEPSKIKENKNESKIV